MASVSSSVDAPPPKKFRPQVPVFISAPQVTASTPPSGPSTPPLTRAECGAEKYGRAEWERRCKAGLTDAYDPANPSASSQPIELKTCGGTTRLSERSDSLATHEGKSPQGLPVSSGPRAKTLEMVQDVVDIAGGASGSVYGFEGGSKNVEMAKKAIALRLEPLGPGVPAFERVLSESKQSVSIGSNRKTVDVLVNDEAVSKTHCTISIVGIKNELALCVVDLSTNGTYINGERLPCKQKRFRVRNGDRLLLKSASLDEEFGWTCDFGNTVAFFSR